MFSELIPGWKEFGQNYFSFSSAEEQVVFFLKSSLRL